MSPVMNARVEKFAHINTCGLPVCHTGSREWRVTKIWGPRCKRDWLSRVNGARDNGIWLYSPETTNLGQIRRFLEAATLKFDGWPWKTIGHLFYATSSFVHHFVAIGEFKLQLQSGNAQSGSNSTIFRGVRPWNLTDDLAKQWGTSSMLLQAFYIIS